jgi:hypothetical protein
VATPWVALEAAAVRHRTRACWLKSRPRKKPARSVRGSTRS